jgi:hypothetical protein
MCNSSIMSVRFSVCIVWMWTRLMCYLGLSSLNLLYPLRYIDFLQLEPDSRVLGAGSGRRSAQPSLCSEAGI